MNWAIFAIGVTAAIFFLCLLRAWPRMTRAGFLASLPQFAISMLNGAAPVRALMDPNYVGWSFGMLHADKGMDVTMQAGGIFLAGIVSGFFCLLNLTGPAMIFVAVFDIVMLIVLGVPTVQTMIEDPSQMKIQFGEYLTLDPWASFLFLAILIIVPLALAANWARRRAMMKKAEAA